MRLVLEIVEKAPQLAGLKNPDMPRVQRPGMGGKHPPNATKLPTAYVKRTRKAFLAKTGLSEEDSHRLLDNIEE
jgi:hypothetical protein